MIVQCPNQKCKWCGEPTFEEFDDVEYVKATCPECHAFIRIVKRQNVPKKCTIIAVEDTWWNKVKATESKLRPAYMIQREVLKLRVDCEVLQAENEHLKEVIAETTEILKDALEREGLVKHVPKWMKE